MSTLTSNQLIVLVERHLGLESRLAEAIEQVNHASAEVFTNGGIRGPSQQELDTLKPMMDDLRKMAADVVEARQTILSRINQTLDSQHTTIKQYIRTLSPEDRKRLNTSRRNILKRSNLAQANLIHNQAVLYYTFDYHRKYLAGVLQSDAKPQSYGANGQTSGTSPGNLYGKTC